MPNLEWLEYVIDCRHGGDLQKEYDIVDGGVANDNVIDTVEDYENGIITARKSIIRSVFGIKKLLIGFLNSYHLKQYERQCPLAQAKQNNHAFVRDP